ncbi:FtsX-like permease family protein [Paenibacillus thermotolerans]|uniref:FtsX-like permease family protein n=1 Tax=Paenibacillus thermotolerans TaxID=3027807 RepID=UPI0023676B7E|nr:MULTISPECIES: ABC transporter permease [unclassified Paenibacillus]
MTFRQLALSNIRGGWRRYAAFFFSSAASVLIFYLFASFIFHPDVRNGQIYGGQAVGQALLGLEYVIFIFSFFFVLYSSSAFYKIRNKEFGLFQMFGMTIGQIRRMALYEQLIIAVCAIGTGIAFGTLFSKLFFMGIADLLDVENPIRFMVVAPAVWLTAGLFFILFFGIALLTLRSVGSQPIIELLRGSRKPKSLPLYSRWLSLLSAVCLGAGYYLAYTTNLRGLLMYMLPILALVVTGSYFLFTQGSVAIVRRLTGTPAFYWRGIRLIAVSQLMFKLKDNARVMFSSAVLTAVVLTASGVITVFYMDNKSQIVQNSPQAFGYEERGDDEHRVLPAGRVKESLGSGGIKLEYELRLEMLRTVAKVQLPAAKEQVSYFVSESGWNEASGLAGSGLEVNLEQGRTMLMYPFRGQRGSDLETKGKEISYEIGGRTERFISEGNRFGASVNGAKAVWVLDDADYARLASAAADSEKRVYYGYEWKGWEDDGAVVERLLGDVPDEMKGRVYERVTDYKYVKQFTALTFFIGIFVVCLFFFASGSLLYFKQFTELEEDRTRFKQLMRIGVSPKEINRIVTAQIGSVFMIPFAVGTVHAAFAYKMLGNVFATSTWRLGLCVVGVFFLLHLLYFVITKRSYFKQIYVSPLS